MKQGPIRAVVRQFIFIRTFTFHCLKLFLCQQLEKKVIPEPQIVDWGVLSGNWQIYFLINSVTKEWVERVVNAQNGQTAYVSKYAGDVVYWPDFLLGVHSVEFFPDADEKVRARPFSASGVILTPSEFLKPI